MGLDQLSSAIKGGVQTKLIALVLGVSLATIMLTGLLSFSVSRHLLAETGYERLDAMGSTQAVAVQHYLEELANHVMTLSEARMTTEAARQFIDAFNKLPDINDKQKQELRAFYLNDFNPKLKRLSGVEMNINTLIPENANQRYLKYNYVAASNAVHLDTSLLADAKDGSPWSQAHSTYHRRLRRYAKLFGYEDILMVDIKTGNIVYSVAKEDDLATNLLEGPYANTPIAKVFAEVKKSKDPFVISYSDFAYYTPSFGKPTMFVGTSIFDGDDFIGVLIFQLSNDRIDKLMTSNRKWDLVGMGHTGETYLVGEDLTFRSSPRFYLQNPKEYLQQARRNGLSASQETAIQVAGTPVLVQSVNTAGARNALAGRSGIASFKDYRGVPVVSFYQPIRFGPFDWGLLAEIDESELFDGIGQLNRNLLLLACLLIPAMAYLTLKMSRAFIRPIRRLQETTELIKAGHYNFEIPVKDTDELGELATAFNRMSIKLADREQMLKQQIEQNRQLLLSILPSSAASRMQLDAKTAAEAHPYVSVLYANIDGWDELSAGMTRSEFSQLFNELSSKLVATGERLGLEKLQTVGTTYLAVSGLSQSCKDHERNAMAAALAMQEVLHRFNHDHNTNLILEIGLHAGPITTGLVSGDRLSFDIWGQTINQARSLQESCPAGGIRVSTPMVKALDGLYRFNQHPAIVTRGEAALEVWEVA